MRQGAGGFFPDDAYTHPRRKGFGKSERVRGARDIEKRTAWLDWTLVYWDGSNPDTWESSPHPAAGHGGAVPAWPGEVRFRPLTQLLAGRLSRHAPGLYAVHVSYLGAASKSPKTTPAEGSRLNPFLGEVVAVTSGLIAASLAAIQASRKYPVELPRRVGNLDSWRARAMRRLQDFSGAMAAVPLLEQDLAEALNLEAAAVWVGRDSGRPSNRLSMAGLAACLEQARDEGAAAFRMAAIAYGRRGGRLPPVHPLFSYCRAGALAPLWPAAVLHRLTSTRESLAQVLAMAHARSAINTPEAETAAAEYSLGDTEQAAAFLAHLPELVHAAGRADPAPGRRRVAQGESGSRSPVRRRPVARDSGPGPNGEWRAAFAGLAGRVCSHAAPAVALSRLVRWFETCAAAAGPRRAASAWYGTVTTLEHWLETCAWAPSDLDALLEALDEFAPGLLAETVSSSVTLERAAWDRLAYSSAALGRLGALSPEERRRICAQSAIAGANQFLSGEPSRLQALAELAPRWAAVTGSGDGATTWARILQPCGRRFAAALLEWAEETVSSGVASTAAVSGFVGDLAWALAGYVPPKRAPAYRRFLAQHRWVLTEAVRTWPRAELDGAQFLRDILEILLAREPQTSAAGLRLAMRAILEHRPDCSAPAAYYTFLGELAGRDDQRFVRLLERSGGAYSDYPDDPADGWAFLRSQPEVRGFLAGCLDAPELVPQVFACLRRIAFVLRLEPRRALGEWLGRWSEPPPVPLPGLPDTLPLPITAQLSLLAAYRVMCGEKEPLPGAVADLLRRPEAQRREREALRELRSTGLLPEAARKRLANLERYAQEDDPAHLAAQVERVCRKQLVLAKLQALEAGPRHALARHWSKLKLPPDLPGREADWENALHIYVRSSKNRRLLRTLLDREAAGDRSWIAAHPANVAFLRRIEAAGADVEKWLAAAVEGHVVGHDRWVLYAETDPLRVLQMGNPFSTCLSATGCNAFSAVANAIEANKRVLYIRNQAGAIIGRRLIGLVLDDLPEAGSQRPCLLGFHSYGAVEPGSRARGPAGSPWVKILFDTFCARLARDTGASLPSSRERAGALSDRLHLFARWYNDGPEEFDWWVTGEDLAAAVLADEPEPLAKSLAWRLRADRLWSRDSDLPRASVARALIWMDDAALPLVESMGPAGIPPEYAAFVARFSQSPAVRALLQEWLRAMPADP